MDVYIEGYSEEYHATVCAVSEVADAGTNPLIIHHGEAVLMPFPETVEESRVRNGKILDFVCAS